MNEQNSNPAPSAPNPIPPAIPAPTAISNSLEDVRPIGGPSALLQALLREPARLRHNLGLTGTGLLSLGLVAILITCAAAYGLVVGSFSGGTQWWASPLKIVSGLLLSAAICLPSLYILAALGGATATLRELAGLVAASAALMSLLLIGLAPVAWVFSQSTHSLAAMAIVHFLFWIVALYFGIRFLTGALGRKPDRTGGLKLWIVIYLLVMFQMTTALRPLLGTADTLLPAEKKFFLAHWSDTLAARPAGAPAP